MLSNAAQYIINRCYKDGKPASTQIIIDNTYVVNGEKIKANEDLVKELEDSGKVVVKRYLKLVNVFGIK